MTGDSSALASAPAEGPSFAAVPAGSVIRECLREQSLVAPRSKLARVIGTSPLSADSRPWYVGAIGELEVAEHLDRLGDEWTVLHAVPIGSRGSDVDHIVAGAAGVFPINTKHHEGAKIWLGSSRMLVNGHRTDHLRNSRHEAKRIRRLLDDQLGFEPPVMPVIALVREGEITVKERPKDVHVTSHRRLHRWLDKQDRVLDVAQLDALRGAVTSPSTWSDSPAEAPVDLDRFDALRAEVRSAKRVRLLWASGGLLAVIGLAAATLAHLLGG